jgi:hypothetical protein
MILDIEEQEQTEEDLNDLDSLLMVRCVRCGKKISLANCHFDENENPVCNRRC